jgi:hypothetical protein
MNKATVRAMQTRLKELGYYAGTIDGDRGPLTERAISAALGGRAADLPADWAGWSARRHAIAFLQLWCHDININAGRIDGYWGPQTDYAVDALLETLDTGAPPDPWRDDMAEPANPRGWPRQSGLSAFFGPHGGIDYAPTPPPPLTNVPCPWPLKIAWNLRQTRGHLRVHEKVADSLAEVLERVHAHYGETEIERLGLNLFGGDYVARRMRGGTSMSMHSWGIAIDFDPANNQLKWGRDRARLAGADYADWWRIWEDEGWLSLGRARNYDWMHVQAARL